MGSRVGTPWFNFGSWNSVLERHPHLIRLFRGNVGRVLKLLDDGHQEVNEGSLNILACDLKPLVEASKKGRESQDKGARDNAWKKIVGVEEKAIKVSDITHCQGISALTVFPVKSPKTGLPVP